MTASPAPQSPPPPNWYPDPSGAPNLRWWDGQTWTEHVQAAPTPTPVTPIGQDPAMRMLIPVGRSGWAIASGYLGLFALIGIGAPFALATGIMAIFDIRKHPEKHGMGRAIFGIVAGVIGLGILGLMFFG